MKTFIVELYLNGSLVLQPTILASNRHSAEDQAVRYIDKGLADSIGPVFEVIDFQASSEPHLFSNSSDEFR